MVVCRQSRNCILQFSVYHVPIKYGNIILFWQVTKTNITKRDAFISDLMLNKHPGRASLSPLIPFSNSLLFGTGRLCLHEDWHVLRHPVTSTTSIPGGRGAVFLITWLLALSSWRSHHQLCTQMLIHSSLPEVSATEKVAPAVSLNHPASPLYTGAVVPL